MLATLGERTAGEQRLAGDHLRPNEAARHVGVDLAGRVLRARPRSDGPRPAFVLARGEEGDVAEQLVRGPNHPVEARASEPQVGQEDRGIRGIELGDLELDPGADRERADAGSLQEAVEPRSLRGGLDGNRRIRFVAVQHEQQGLGREKLEASEQLGGGDVELEAAEGGSRLERSDRVPEELELGALVLRESLAPVLLDALDAPLRDPQIRQDELVLHRPHVARRIDRFRRVRHGVVPKGPHHVQKHVGGAIGRHVDERGAGRGAGRHVDEGHRGRRALARGVQLRQPIEPEVRDRRQADAGVLPGRGLPARFPRAGQELEQSGLARRGDSDQSGAQHAGGVSHIAPAAATTPRDARLVARRAGSPDESRALTRAVRLPTIAVDQIGARWRE